MRVSLRRLVVRVGSTLVVMWGTLQVYQGLNARLAPRYDFGLPIDACIPFWPWTLLVYVSFYALFPLAAWWAPPGSFGRILMAVLTVNVCCWVGFVAFPAHVPRPPLDGVSPAWLREGVAVMWRGDLPGNTLPSLHVATSLLVALRLREARGGPVWLVWSAAIALSTLTVKQHVVADVLVGALLALVVNVVFFPPRARRASKSVASPRPAPSPPRGSLRKSGRSVGAVLPRAPPRPSAP
ncbi:MAG: phosphatase PAP2 family protein [Myxococcaceae bacterium]|nr:phosphatase PAP2 family protein [Myxococcaceae bacterium]MCA3016292.1 phosphatase PAP2 family protein [Myxococcaceae bacterium]